MDVLAVGTDLIWAKSGREVKPVGVRPYQLSIHGARARPTLLIDKA
jgi:hypothetical protein